jgi:DNA-binding HxlR family transcriptional regulator
MKENIEFRSLCPVATSLDIIGDKWTLLILRDMIWGHKTMFHEFKESPEKMPSKMLSNRLKKLESIGFISKQKGTVNKKSIYYLLEKRGFDTFPIMIEMAIFTTKHFFDHLGTTYTGDVKKRMLKDKLDYTKELISNYKQFVRLQTF